ncbi:MAG: TniQ family protein [Roseinatronobacter sp.]
MDCLPLIFVRISGTFPSIVNGDPEALRVIALLGGVNPDELSAWSPVVIGSRRLSFRGHIFHGKAVRNPELRACPICLREDAQSSELPPEQAMGMRGHWGIPHVATCVRHDHPLVTVYRDPHATARYDSAKHLAAITTVILNGELDLPQKDPTSFEDWLDDRLTNGPGSDWLSGQPQHSWEHISKSAQRL